MGEDVSCPACGRMMLPTTGGYFCPACRHRSSQSTIFQGGPATPPLGLRVGPADEETMLDPSLRPDGMVTPVPGKGPPVGASIFDSGSGLDSEADALLPLAQPNPASSVSAPAEEPEIYFAEDDGGQGAFGETVVMPGQKKGPPDAGGDDEVSSIVPEKQDALFLPRCRSCNEVLELEEIADGECANCRESGGRPAGRRGRKRRPAPGPPPGALASASGALAALAATWVGVLVVIRAIQSDPGTWGGPQLLMESWRLGLVLFALAASILWACGKPWAGGAALALGVLAAALAAVMVKSGELVDDIHAASAWMLAGASGALAAAAAMVPRHEFAASGRRRGARARGRRRPRSTSEVMAAPSRRSRVRGSGVNRLRAVLGGLLALAAAGVAGWQAALAFRAAPDALGTFFPEGVRIYGFGTAALFMGFVALWLLIGPPRGRTRILALCAAVVAGPLPGWLVIGPGLAESAGLGTIDAGGWLALPAGLGRLLGAEFLADLAPASVAAELKIAAAVALGLGLVASVFVLFTRSEGRGRGLAGFALACVLVWGAGFSTALAPPASPATAEARSEAAAGEDAGAAAPPEEGSDDQGTPSGDSGSAF
ncbi:MAG: hypothetical protein ACYTKD_24510 [Planctomycetota bacterium]